MFIIARKHITPRRMLYRTRIVLESCSYRNCNRPIKDNSRMTARERPQLIAFSANLHAAAGNTMQHASAIYNNNGGPP